MIPFMDWVAENHPQELPALRRILEDWMGSRREPSDYVHAVERHMGEERMRVWRTLNRITR